MENFEDNLLKMCSACKIKKAGILIIDKTFWCYSQPLKYLFISLLTYCGKMAKTRNYPKMSCGKSEALSVFFITDIKTLIKNLIRKGEKIWITRILT